MTMSTNYSLPWSSQEDSAFHEEPDYANSSASQPQNLPRVLPHYSPTVNSSYLLRSRNSHEDGSCHSSPCPDYEEVENNMTKNMEALQLKGLVYNLASEGIFHCKKEEGKTLGDDPVTKEKIMKSLIYCIHKVNTSLKIIDPQSRQVVIIIFHNANT